jgi:hypothetical protein
MKESFPLAAAPNLFQERKTTRKCIAASFHERGKENQSNYIKGIGMELLTKWRKSQAAKKVSLIFSLGSKKWTRKHAREKSQRGNEIGTGN